MLNFTEIFKLKEMLEKAKIEIDCYPGEDWELIADGYLNCLHEILEICDEKNLSNPKKIEEIRRRLYEEI